MTSRDNHDLLMKIIVIGDAGTGKSCMLHRFIYHEFNANSSHTIGVEFGSKIVDMDGQRVKLQIWDTSGQERYLSVTRSYYRGAMGCLMVYDVTRRSTFENIPRWIQEAKSLTDPNCAMMLVGNKCDLTNKEITHTEASQFAQEENVMMFETSAANGEFIEEAFLKVARTALSRKKQSESAKTTDRSQPQTQTSSLLADSPFDENERRSKKGCC
eukprot:TRINITY_DN2269_c0_g3_i3.p1 TRINITY_DN2269_c0_g3~~TRINITY_DN2269_c0_g3_i3.p1  ORF type:complete len:234 (+),score=55.64 TRINITY_DN2269_c0_g3_i3:61-702(+)